MKDYTGGQLNKDLEAIDSFYTKNPELNKLPMQETKQKECGMCCKLVPPKCVNKNCVCHTETKQKEIREEWKGWNELCKKLNLREETISGFDEIGTVKNFISTLLSEDRAKTVEKLSLCKIPSCDCCMQLRELKLLNNRE